MFGFGDHRQDADATSGSDCDVAGKDEIGRAGEDDVGEAVFCAEEINAQGVAAFDQHADGGLGAGEGGDGEGGGDNAGAAGEGFGFDAAFVGADGEVLGSELADKIDVGSAGLEVMVMAEGGAELVDVGAVEVVDEEHGVGDAGVDRVDGEGLSGGVESDGVGEGSGLAHSEGDLVAAQGGADEAGGGFEAERAVFGGRELVDEAGEAAGTVAAHFGFAAVGIVVAHAEVGFGFGALDEKDSIGADAAVAVAQEGDLGVGERERAVAVVQHDEVIAGAVHLGEMQNWH